jgi:hypothetical protein
MSIAPGEALLVGLVALALVPLTGLRLYRGLRDGRLPVYRTHIARAGSAGKFWFLFVLHASILVVVALVAADLLLGLGLRDRL